MNYLVSKKYYWDGKMAEYISSPRVAKRQAIAQKS
jgi:hypothetical protein